MAKTKLTKDFMIEQIRYMERYYMKADLSGHSFTEIKALYNKLAAIKKR